MHFDKMSCNVDSNVASSSTRENSQQQALPTIATFIETATGIAIAARTNNKKREGSAQKSIVASHTACRQWPLTEIVSAIDESPSGNQ